MTNRRHLALEDHKRGSQSLITLRDAKIGWIVLHKDIDPSVFAKLKSTIEKELGEGIALPKVSYGKWIRRINVNIKLFLTFMPIFREWNDVIGKFSLVFL